MSMLNMAMMPHMFRGNLPIGTHGGWAWPIHGTGYAERVVRYINPNWNSVLMSGQTGTRQHADINGVFYPSFKPATLNINQDDTPATGVNSSANRMLCHKLPNRFTTYPVYLPNQINTNIGVCNIECANDGNIHNPDVTYWPSQGLSVIDGNASGTGLPSTGTHHHFHGVPTPGNTIVVPNESDPLERNAILPVSNVRWKRTTSTTNYLYVRRYLVAYSTTGTPLTNASWRLGYVGYYSSGASDSFTTLTDAAEGNSTAIPDAFLDVIRIIKKTGGRNQVITSYIRTLTGVTGSSWTLYVIAELTNDFLAGTGITREQAFYFCNGSWSSGSTDRNVNHTHQHQHHNDSPPFSTVCGNGFFGVNAYSDTAYIDVTQSLNVQFTSASTTLSHTESRTGVNGFSVYGPLGISGGLATQYGRRLPYDLSSVSFTWPYPVTTVTQLLHGYFSTALKAMAEA